MAVGKQEGTSHAATCVSPTGEGGIAICQCHRVLSYVKQGCNKVLGSTLPSPTCSATTSPPIHPTHRASATEGEEPYPPPLSSTLFRLHAETLVQPHFEKGDAILHAQEASGGSGQELQVGQQHHVTEDGVVVVWGGRLRGSCARRQPTCWIQSQTSHSQKRAAASPAPGTTSSLVFPQPRPYLLWGHSAP